MLSYHQNLLNLLKLDFFSFLFLITLYYLKILCCILSPFCYSYGKHHHSSLWWWIVRSSLFHVRGHLKANFVISQNNFAFIINFLRKYLIPQRCYEFSYTFKYIFILSFIAVDTYIWKITEHLFIWNNLACLWIHAPCKNSDPVIGIH